MPIDPTACGTVSLPFERAWTSTDCILYALAVGAGRDDQLAELEFTTENTEGVPQRVLPAFGAIIGRPSPAALLSFGSFDPAVLVQAGQSVEVHAPIPVDGAVRATTTVTAIEDKGSGALVTLRTESVECTSGARLLTTMTSLFVRGAGGFAHPDARARTSTARPAPPERAPDHRVTYATLPGQALLYRLCGDRNPLHSDPAFATAAGFDRPILHGLCAYGFTCRALLQAVCGDDADRFRSMQGRFAAPTFPGDALTIAIWDDDDGHGATFTTTSAGATVISDGRLQLRP